MNIAIPTDTPLARVLIGKKDHYEGGYLDELMQKSQDADDVRDTLGGSAFGAKANGAFIVFKRNLDEYERICDVLRGKREPSKEDLRAAEEEAIKAAGTGSRYVWR